MAANATRECLIKPRNDDMYSYDLPNESRHTYTSWNGWMIGAYVYAWLLVDPIEEPASNGCTWRDYPVLLVDVWKRTNEHTQFIVAHLYDRNAAVNRLKRVTRFAWLTARFREWPARRAYVLSNHFELVYEWELRTWSRSDPPFIPANYSIDTCSNKLERCKLRPTTDIGRALQITPTFTSLMQLPREIRAIIYGYALLDEVQKTSRSRVHICSMLRSRCKIQKNVALSRHHDHHTLGSLPRLQTPGLLRVCRQIRSEALDDVYRTKILVVSIPPGGTAVMDLNPDCLPDMFRFLHMRIDLALDFSSSLCPPFVLDLLQRRVQFLQIVIRLEEHSSTPSCSDVARCIRALLSLLKRLTSRETNQPLQLTWGITGAQKAAGDYSCMITYLSGIFLQHMWECVHEESSGAADRGCPAPVQREACDSMGCRLHRRRADT